MNSRLDDPVLSTLALPLAGAPLYERLAAHYRQAIAAGSLSAGDRMPSLRALMARHQVSLSTALEAMRRMEDAGWLEARPRSGYFVKQPPGAALAAVREPDPRALPAQARYVGLHEAISSVTTRWQAAPQALNLGGATADASLYPTARLQSLAVALLRRHPTLLTEAGSDAGVAPYRQAIARRALRCGIAIAPEDVVVTSGGVESVNLALRAATQVGDTVAIESPAFSGLLQIIESLGLRALEIPTSPTTGLSVEALEIALSAYPDVKAVVVVPHLQNPLGCVMPDDRKRELVGLCARRGVALIEDEPYRELLDDADSHVPLKAMDRDGGVIHCASFNKVLAPGMRLGWMAAGRWQPRVRMLKHAQSRLNESLSQRVAAEFIGSPAFDRHLHQLRQKLRVQREATAQAIARAFPAGTRLSPPAAGMLLWVELPGALSSDALFDAALAEGVRIAPGSIFSNSGRYDGFIRISCPRPFDARMDEAIVRLGRIAAAMVAAST